MRFFKKLWDFLWTPPLWAVVLSYLLTLLSAGVALFAVFTERSEEVWVYPVYALAAVSLFCATIITVSISRRWRTIFEKMAGRYAFIDKIRTDAYYRNVLTTSIGFLFGFAYAAFIGVLAVLGGSAWYGALAVYHFAFSVMRFLLIKQGKKADACIDQRAREDGKARAHAMNGWFLIILALTLAASVVLQITVFGASFRYAGLMIYAFAAYAFYKITRAIIRIIRIKKQNDYIIKALIASNLASAGVSLLSLQTALLDAFSTGAEMNVALFNALMGGAVCIGVAVLGVLSIWNGRKKIKEVEKVYGTTKGQ